MKLALFAPSPRPRSLPALVAGGALVLAAASGIVSASVGGAPHRPAATLTVTSTNDVDDGACSAYPAHCSLREAVNAANAAGGADTIDFHPTVVGTIALASALPHLADGVTVVGPGTSVVTVKANGLTTVLWVDPGVTATVSGLSLTGGIGTGAGGTAGGGVVNRGTLTLSHMAIVTNTAQYGGAIFNDLGADLVLVDSTLRGNSATSFGGAIYSVGGGTVVSVARSTISGNTSDTNTVNAPAGTSLTISNSTISGNIATQPGGVGGTWGGINVNIASSTIVGNTGIGVFGGYLRNTIVDSCGSGGGSVGSQGHNLAPSSACFFTAGPGDVYNPSFLLGPLQNNGGPTETHALLAASPAIDAGDNGTCPAVDQRGYPRPFGASCDIGAYEYRATPPATPTPTLTPASRPTATITPTPTPGCVLPPAGMVAWYPLDEPPGAISVADIWGGHIGTPVPGPVGGSFAPGFGPVPGPVAPGIVPPFMVAGSLYFWDQQRLVDVPHSTALDIGTGAFTIDGWVYSVTHVSGGTADFVSPIVDKFDPAASLGYGLYLRHPVSGPDTLEFVYGDGTTIVTATTTPPALPQLAWVHVAVTLERLGTGQLDIRLYVNGLQQGALVAPPPAAPIANAQTLHIGGTRLVPTVIGNVGYTEIAIDELEIFRRALSQPEIQSLVAVGSHGKCPPAKDDPTRTPTATRTPKPTPTWPWVVYLPWAITTGHPGGTATPRPASPTALPSATALPSPADTPTFTPTATLSLPVPTTPVFTPTPSDTSTPTVEPPTATPSLTAPAGTAVPTTTSSPTAPPTTAVPATSTTTPSTTATPTASATDTPTGTPTGVRPCSPPPTPMAAWWPLDELGGTTAWDAVGGNHGVVQGGASVLNPAQVAAGRLFDGTTGLVAVPDAPAIEAGAGDFSLDAWILPRALDGARPIVTKQNAPADAPLGYALTLEDGQLAVTMSNDASAVSATAPVTMTVDGKWHLVAVTIVRGSATGGQLYLDGAPIHTFDTTPLVGPVDTAAELHIGEQPALGRGLAARTFSGGIDEVELFHHALSPADVLAIYTAGTHGKCDKPPPPTTTPQPMTRSAQRHMPR